MSETDVVYIRLFQTKLLLQKKCHILRCFVYGSIYLALQDLAISKSEFYNFAEWMNE